jgi:hypothetical protein
MFVLLLISLVAAEKGVDSCGREGVLDLPPPKIVTFQLECDIGQNL